MNLGQAVVSLGNGCYAWREDISPAPTILAYTLLCIHDTMAFAEMRLRPSAERRTSKPAPKPAEEDQPDVLSALTERMLTVLRAAFRAGDKLSFAEVCQRAGCAKSKHAHEMLQRLHLRGLIHSGGKNRGTVYWAEEQSESTT